MNTSTPTRITGRVKWFNTKSGYGFLTVINSSTEEDIFVHHSAIQVISEQYRYLVQGEYIEFEMTETDGSKGHKWTATKVSGISGGKLMCETHNDNNVAYANNRPAAGPNKELLRTAKTETPAPISRQYSSAVVCPRKIITRTQDPVHEEGVEWLLVKRRTNSRAHST